MEETIKLKNFFASLRSTVTGPWIQHKRSRGVPILNEVALERWVNLPTRKQKKKRGKKKQHRKRNKRQNAWLP